MIEQERKQKNLGESILENVSILPEDAHSEEDLPPLESVKKSPMFKIWFFKTEFYFSYFPLLENFEVLDLSWISKLFLRQFKSIDD